MIAMAITGAVAMLVSLLAGPVLIQWLHARGIGQQIREEGPEGHLTKAGTPTMGGVLIVVGAVAGYIAGHVRVGAVFTRGGLLVMLSMLGAGAVGLADDWIKVTRQRSLGLNKRAKLGGQLVVAVTFAYFAIVWAHVQTRLGFTRWSFPGWDLGPVVWVALAVIVVLATTNAVNLTDGLDGLAAGSSSFCFACLSIMAFWMLRYDDIYRVPQALDLALVAVAMLGGCAGFLWWNAAPARIFMGDTGSLAIGGALAGLVMIMNVPLLLPVLGALFVLETLSVVIQVASFQAFHRRMFRMAPIHHHFELLGWPETTVLIRFWILAALSAAMALGIFYADFISLGGLD